MQTVKLDNATWDLDIVDGKLVIISDLQALKQYIKQRLLLWKGEYFLDITRGVDYTNIMGAKNILNKKIFIDVIEGAGHNTRVLSISLSLVNRTLEVTFSADSDYGRFDSTVVI